MKTTARAQPSPSSNAMATAGRGATTKSQRHTSSTIYHVVQGEGVTSVGEKKAVRDNLNWGAKDCFFVPSWNWYQFTNKSSKEPAILFSVTDRPVLESLGL